MAPNLVDEVREAIDAGRAAIVEIELAGGTCWARAVEVPPAKRARRGVVVDVGGVRLTVDAARVKAVRVGA